MIMIMHFYLPVLKLQVENLQKELGLENYITLSGLIILQLGM